MSEINFFYDYWIISNILLHNLNFEKIIRSIRDCTIKYKIELEYYSCVALVDIFTL